MPRTVSKLAQAVAPKVARKAAPKIERKAVSRPAKAPNFSAQQVALAKAYAALEPPRDIDPRIAALVNDLIGRVADKWTMLILEVLAEHGPLRFSRLGEQVTGVSQKMLTQTVRQMERDGLLTRTVYAVVPPKVEYELTDLGLSLGGAFCGVWIWAAENLKRVEKARAEFDAQRVER